MVDLIERIGPYLGIAAFLGLAILAFLIFQQAREVRRLREWAGRAPERASEAAGASLAAAEARGEVAEPEPAEPGRIGIWWEGVRSWTAARWEAIDRRMPVDPRYLLAVLAAAVVAVAVLTSGFGLLGGDDAGGGSAKGERKKEGKPEVAVLNATQVEENGVEIAGEPGLAGKVAEGVLIPAGYQVGKEGNAVSGLEATVIMFDKVDDEEAAEKLAGKVADKLGETGVVPMLQEVRDRADGAPLALVIGQDDADF